MGVLPKLIILSKWGRAIPQKDIYPEKIIIQNDTCTSVFIVALFIVAEMWKKPRCPLTTDEWIKKLWYTYTMEYSTPCNGILLSLDHL